MMISPELAKFSPELAKFSPELTPFRLVSALYTESAQVSLVFPCLRNRVTWLRVRQAPPLVVQAQKND